MVNYADDFVILCRGTAQKARDAAEQIITGMKLRMNQEKTQIVDASRQPFDFLGYTFGPCFAARSSAVYLGARPSKGRIKRLYGKVREHLSRGNNDPLEDVVDYAESDACGLVSVLLLRHAVQSVPDRGLSRASTTTVVALSQAQGEGERNTTVPRRQAVQQVRACLSGQTPRDPTFERLR